MGIPDHLTCLLRNLYAGQEATVRTRHGTTTGLVQNGERTTSSRLCTRHPAYLSSTQNTSREMPGWMKHKLESRLLGEISINSDVADDTTLMAESEELKIKSLLMKVKEESEKADLERNIQKN